ncbi:hypothetical protein D6C94_10606 [Aureobasidium pullulans]|uniref:Aminoglycoside phosphotransferase domain-containing protein n=1 Tax=Aureobasidium pullulans TaxID=5580 RepID=A0AB38LH45_AURPU|nr:hypothetical protein D6C94_10606 [Aureobasidium pullulans]
MVWTTTSALVSIVETASGLAIQTNRGVDIPAYCNGLIDIALTRLPPPDRSHPNEKSYQGRVEEYVQLLGIARKILQILARHPRINDNASLTTMHLDLHLHNIFVDPDDATIITAFIDWQGTGIEPAFEHAGMVLDLKTTQLHFPGKRDSEGDSHLVLERAYDALVKVYVPRLGAVRNIDDDLLRLFRYCHRTWVDGITVLRDELINLSTRVPPSTRTERELSRTITDYKGWLDTERALGRDTRKPHKCVHDFVRSYLSTGFGYDDPRIGSHLAVRQANNDPQEPALKIWFT